MCISKSGIDTGQSAVLSVTYFMAHYSSPQINTICIMKKWEKINERLAAVVMYYSKAKDASFCHCSILHYKRFGVWESH